MTRDRIGGNSTQGSYSRRDTRRTEGNGQPEGSRQAERRGNAGGLEGLVSFARRTTRTDTNGQLMDAAERNDVGSARAALEGGADPNRASRRRGHTPLTRALKHGSDDVAALLMQQPGVNVNQENINTGMRPLHYAMESPTRNAGLVQDLVDRGAARDAASHFGAGDTALSLAARMARSGSPRSEDIAQRVMSGPVPATQPPLTSYEQVPDIAAARARFEADQAANQQQGLPPTYQANPWQRDGSA